MATASHSGRKRSSPVWDYFKYDEASGKTVCQVKMNDKICETNFKGKFSTNLKLGQLKNQASTAISGAHSKGEEHYKGKRVSFGKVKKVPM